MPTSFPHTSHIFTDTLNFLLGMQLRQNHKMKTSFSPEMKDDEVWKDRPKTTLAIVESLAVPLVQEVVFLADFRCLRCQNRVVEIMSKMNGETQAVVIAVLEKKVTLTCTYPNSDSLPRSWWRKLPRILRPSCSYSDE